MISLDERSESINHWWKLKSQTWRSWFFKGWSTPCELALVSRQAVNDLFVQANTPHRKFSCVAPRGMRGIVRVHLLESYFVVPPLSDESYKLEFTVTNLPYLRTKNRTSKLHVFSFSLIIHSNIKAPSWNFLSIKFELLSKSRINFVPAAWCPPPPLPHPQSLSHYLSR